MTENSLEWTVGLALLAGLSIPVGALVASNVVLRNVCLRLKLDSFMSYFGGGALLAAIALVLIPRGLQQATVFSTVVTFAAGGLVFWQFSAWTRRTRNTASQFLGMLLDFFPEAILLGVSATRSSNLAYLLAGLIALQNMPEGFSAYREMENSVRSRRRLLMIFIAAAVVGPLAAWAGFTWLSSSESMLSAILLFCSGGILYLIFEDIAPGAHIKHASFPAMGAIGGFLIGMIATMLIH